MEKELFLNGYCLEYACALKNIYDLQGKETFICGIIKGKLEEGSEEENVYEKQNNGLFLIVDPFEIVNIEVSHYFLAYKDSIGNFVFEDINGEISLEDLLKNSSFSRIFDNISPKAIIFENEVEAESFSSEIDNELVENLIKELKRKKKD